MISGSSKPAASVIMAVYNAERYLPEAIESVPQQSFTDLELLLLNDGSTDGSLKILESFVARDERCRLYSWSNMGRTLIRNEGSRLAKADVLCIMDADHICLPKRIEMEMAYLEQHPECVAVGSKVLLVDSEEEPLCEFVDVFDHASIDAAHLAGRGGMICHPAVAMRRDAFLRVGGYRAEFPVTKDLDLFLRLAEIGQLANIPQVLLKYRQHPQASGYTERLLQVELTNQAIADACNRRGLRNMVVQASQQALLTQEPSLAAIHQRWAWWALSSGHLKSAKKHAFKAIRYGPFHLSNWKLIACVLRAKPF